MQKRPQSVSVSGGEPLDSDAERHVATVTHALDDQGYTKVHFDLYRSEAGAFSLVQVTETFSATKGSELQDSVRYPLSYDQAHAFVRGEEIEVPGRMIGSMQVDILDETIFPPVPEASGEEKR